MTAPVDETATEYPTGAESATSAAENAEKAPVDTTAFEVAVETLLEVAPGADNSAEIFEVRREYHEFDRNGKTVARKLVEERATTAIMNSDIHGAQVLIRLKDEMIKPMPVSGTPRAPKAPKNSSDDVIAQIAAITLAYSLAFGDAKNNPAMDADFEAKVAELATADAQQRSAAYATWLKNKQEGDEPQISEIEKAAARISLGRAPKGQGRKPKGVEEAAKAAAAQADEDIDEDGIEETDAVATEADFDSTQGGYSAEDGYAVRQY